jgi:mono/diheme cytochrome c family protein
MFDSPGPQPQEEALLPPDNTLPAAAVQGAGDSNRMPAGMDRRDEVLVKGKELFDRYCSTCHGSDARGRELTEDFFTPDITEEDFIERHDDEVYAVIMEGGLSMPNYRDVLNERDCQLVIEYLRILQNGQQK